MRFTHYAATLFATFLILTACGSGGKATSTATPFVTPLIPTSVPTAQPITAPQATTAPTRVASLNTLPAPIYATTNGQIVRIERDGTTVTPITHEPSEAGLRTVVSVSVSPKDSALAYLVQKPAGGMALIRSDSEGQNRTILFDNLAAGTASSPLWSPDGAGVVIAVTGANSSATIGDGIYLVPSDGIRAGKPKRLYPPVQPNGTEPGSNTSGYTPVTFSPDGSMLIVSRYGQLGMCALATMPVAGGQLHELKSTDAAASIPCGLAAWSSDSSAVYTSFLPANGPLVSNTGIWRVDATTGKGTVLVPGVTNTKHLLVHTLATGSDDTINAMVQNMDMVPPYGETAGLTYQWARVDITSGNWMLVRPETYAYADQVFWSPDGNGLLVQTTDDTGLSTLTWTSQDASAPRVLTSIADLGDVTWGRP